jgi:Kdo2-lipid IVA lauroyltransferase/acyltransferase
MKQLMKRLSRVLARAGLYFLFLLARFFPYRFGLWIAKGLMAFSFLFLLKRRKIALENLRMVFCQEKTDQEIRSLVKKCFMSAATNIAELAYFATKPSLFKDKVVFENKEYISQAIKQGNGAVLVSGHFGNFPLMISQVAMAGFPTSVIIRPPRDNKVLKYFKQLKNYSCFHSIDAVPKKKCVTESLRALRAKELLFVLLDQHSGSAGGVMVDFFGQKAATAAGPVVFALRTQAPIVPIFIVRQPDDTHKIIVEPPLAIEHGATEEETLVKNVSRITQIIERYVRQYPEEWGWMHRRWKGRSTGKTTI